MSEKDKDTLEQGGEPEEFVPGEEEFEEELEAEEPQVGGPTEPSRPGRRLGFRHAEEEEEAHPLGSVRATHERVHIDDRASALFVLVAAIGLIAILIVPLVVAAWPAGPAPALPTLNLQTYTTPPTAPPATPTPTPAPSTSPAVSPAPAAS